MINNITPEDLISFEDDIANCFNNKQIRSPIHLSFDNEKELIEIFKEINEDDWCVCSWRSHLHCLLKGMSPEKVKQDILNNRSIEMCNKEKKIFSSAIVSGNISIGLGIAMDIKRKNQTNKIYVFVGDMTACSGQFYEALSYANNFQLPIVFVIEDNGKSVTTNTLKTWRYHSHPYEPDYYFRDELLGVHKYGKIWYYQYDLSKKYQHAGSNQRIQF